MVGDKIRKQGKSQWEGLRCHAEIAGHSLATESHCKWLSRTVAWLHTILLIPAHHPSPLGSFWSWVFHKNYELSPPAPDPLKVWHASWICFSNSPTKCTKGMALVIALKVWPPSRLMITQIFELCLFNYVIPMYKSIQSTVLNNSRYYCLYQHTWFTFITLFKPFTNPMW